MTADIAASYSERPLNNAVSSGSTSALTSIEKSDSDSLGHVRYVMSNIIDVVSNNQGQKSALGSSRYGSNLDQGDIIIVARGEVLNKLQQITLSLIEV